MAKWFPSPKIIAECNKRTIDCTLKMGDRIAILPYNFLNYSIIPYGVNATDFHRLLITRSGFVFVEKGIVCAINRKDSSDKEFVPFILPLSFIISRWLLDVHNIGKLRYSEQKSKDPDKTKQICEQIFQSIDSYSAIQCNKVYTVSGIGEVEAEVLFDRYDNYHSEIFTWISLAESECSIYFNGVDCLIGNQLIDKQLFDDYVEDCMHSEELFSRWSNLPSMLQIIHKIRSVKSSKSRMSEWLITEQMKDSVRKLCEENVQKVGDYRGDGIDMKDWVDVGSVALVKCIGFYNGEGRFIQESINELQVNIKNNTFRIKVNAPFYYWDLQRINISSSIFTRQWVYQVIQNKLLYILEDLSKRAICLNGRYTYLTVK